MGKVAKTVGISCEFPSPRARKQGFPSISGRFLQKVRLESKYARIPGFWACEKHTEKVLLEIFKQRQEVFVLGFCQHLSGKSKNFYQGSFFEKHKRGMEFKLGHAEPVGNTSEELSKVLLARFGLLPRKKDGSAQLHKLLLELYERKKQANREKRPEASVMPVEDMALYADIKRQTMYDHLNRWLDLNVLKKTSFVSGGKVVIGYELNGTNLEGAFRKAEATLKAHLDASFRILDTLQNEIKKEKLRSTGASTSTARPTQPDSSSPDNS